ncbi:hypothetical protein [Sphingomonas endophytica]|uniref:hypothetical protein n=1 Tax=Sphingomonas endophytica TaxID=869719 RepID=UPI001F4CEF2A|nr:hypothetical protein [Sphingomonas endophytica]
MDDTIALARVARERRRGGEMVPVRRRRARSRGNRTVKLVVAIGVLLTLAMLFGWSGFALVAVAAAIVALTVLVLRKRPAPVPTPEKIAQAELKTLPAQTARWLEAQRPALPAPAVTLVERLDRRLDTLAGQLATLDDDSPVAGEIRRLVGEQLPAFVADYARVPPTMRATPRNGKTPDQQLVEGLGVIEREMGDISARLAQGDLDALETKRRFLEVKYEGE